MDIKGFPVEMLHCSTFGSYFIQCEIVGYNDTDFIIIYKDPVYGKYEHTSVPHNQVTGWSWPAIHEFFFKD